MADQRKTSSQGARAWQGGAPRDPHQQRVLKASSRRKKIYISVAVILALLGILAAWLFFIHVPNEPYFLPADARIDDPKSWYKFSEILQNLRDCPSEHKLLILDIMRPLINSRLGLVAGDVAERVQAVVQAAEDKDLLVLTACSPGQVSL